LRKALDSGSGANPIRTVRGSGYAFDEAFAQSSRTIGNH
jgi:DNA-binding winged helix-turn-helix (wHTH) protein